MDCLKSGSLDPGLESNIGSLVVIVGFLFKGVFFLGGGYAIGALITRIGFGAHYTTFIVRNPQHSIGNYLGPYIMWFKGSLHPRAEMKGESRGFRFGSWVSGLVRSEGVALAQLRGFWGP